MQQDGTKRVAKKDKAQYTVHETVRTKGLRKNIVFSDLKFQHNYQENRVHLW